MDGTADLTYVLSALEKEGARQAVSKPGEVIDDNGAIIRMNRNEKSLYLVFSADEFGEGAGVILDVLKAKNVKGSFFLTGNYLRNPAFSQSVKQMISDKHFVGPHSDKHLLYNSWEKRDSLLVTKEQFVTDIIANYDELKKKSLPDPVQRFYLAPYEWYNSTISAWCGDLGIKLINLTPGTSTNADYTTPDMVNYQPSDRLLERLKKFESSQPDGLNGAFVLVHLGTDPKRTDKLYNKLGEMIDYFVSKGYSFKKL
jgi:endoglucanase